MSFAVVRGLAEGRSCHYFLHMNFLYHMQCVQAVKAFLRKNGVVIQNKNSSNVNVTHDIIFANVKGCQKYFKVLLPSTRLNFSIK